MLRFVHKGVLVTWLYCLLVFAGGSAPTQRPTFLPTQPPTSRPSVDYTSFPTSQPSVSPYPSRPSGQPSGQPTGEPTSKPTPEPSHSQHPTMEPQPSYAPTVPPTSHPSVSHYPSKVPSGQPTTIPSGQPSGQPTINPTGQPTSTELPTRSPTAKPTTALPTVPTQPTFAPSTPTAEPTYAPTWLPSSVPTAEPTGAPTTFQTLSDGTRVAPPTGQPTGEPSGQPTTEPSRFEDRDRFGVGNHLSSSPTALFSRDSVTGTVYFDPVEANVCEDTEVRIHLDMELRINVYGGYRISMPGFTIGDCVIPPEESAPKVGQKLFASWPFEVHFFEGSAWDMYQGSYIIAENYAKDVGNVEGFDIIIDRSNGLKPTCPGNNTWNVFRFINSPLRTDPYPTAAPTMEDTDWYKCFFYDASLSFHPAKIQFDTSVNLTINLGFALEVGDEIEIQMPGFTNKKAGLPANPGLVYSISDTITSGADATLSGITTLSTLQVGGVAEAGAWTGNWYEGDIDKDYEDSYLKLTAARAFPAAKSFNIIIDRCPNGLVSILGRQPNHSGFKLKTPTELNGRGSTFDSTRFSVQAIGDNCADLNYCSGNGNCNSRNSTCECYDGYGSPRDLILALADNFAPDCSSKRCPTGPAYANLPRDLVGLHREMECSNNGQCDRSNGICKCFNGFEGGACERRNCPRPTGDPNAPVCSNRGDGDRDSWDANMFHACVCDSSWEVGLGAGQTQLAEFFGPACSFRRCPSGDDPPQGNLCHIDCSNAGTCDHKTGVCTCYEGFYGTACSMRRVDMATHTVRRQAIKEL
eukprot:GSChrysophyteH1.ASY1.ANO1.1600.1 assembled CDS